MSKSVVRPMTFPSHNFFTPFNFSQISFVFVPRLKIQYSLVLPGCMYDEVTISDGKFFEPDNAKNGYQFSQARGLAILDTRGSSCGDVGLVAVIPVGMGVASKLTFCFHFWRTGDFA